MVQEEVDEFRLSEGTQNLSDLKLEESQRTSRNDSSVDKPKDPYVLMRNCNASTRLTAQHFLWTDLLGFLIHPDIPTRASDLKVADIATGNGIWLQQVARNKPTSAEFHGFDISLDQVSAKPWLPANIYMHTWDIFEEPPTQFMSYFDIVHVRLITVVVRNNDPRPILANLLKLLKPGGFLQWDEVDNIGTSIKTVPGVKADNLRALLDQVNSRDTWKYHLKQIMDENGGHESSLSIYEYGLSSARLWSDVYVSTYKEYVDVIKEAEMSRRLEEKAMVEVREGAAIIIPKLVWVTKKA